MECKELTHQEYVATMATPMRMIKEGDTSYGPFPIAAYVDDLIAKLSLPTSREDIEIHYIYMNDRDGYCHILFNWGIKNVYLVLITKPEHKAVCGYHLLDLNAEYGLSTSEGS